MKSVHYRMLNLVGEGQFGKVYSGIHRETGELVALKELNASKFSTKKFLREIRILLILHHHNIVCCEGLEHSKKNRYLVTEYCEAGTLRDLMESPISLNIEQKLKLITDILAGLAYTHLQGIIHRDLKPENILLSLSPYGWVAKISDFGVAKIEKEDKQNDSYSLGDTGSPAYMAPEQFYGKYSYSSDIYAVGIILYELLTGNRPFSGSPQEIMVGHLNQHPQIPSKLPKVLQEILNIALAKLPQHRFRTAKEMRLRIVEHILNLDSNIFPDNPYFDGYLSGKKTGFTWKQIDTVDDLISFSAINNKYIYLAHNCQLTIKGYQVNDHGDLVIDSTKNHSFEGVIVDLKAVEDGCVITIKDNSVSNGYQLLFYNSEITLLKSVTSDIVISAIAPNCSWLALGKQSQLEQEFQIVKLNNLTPLTPVIKEFCPQEIIAIDQGHGLIMFQQKEVNKDYTFLRFFTRKGGWYHNYCLSVPIENIVAHKRIKHHFIAREKFTNCVILIGVRPLQLKRIPLPFFPEFISSYNNYFLCSSSSGKLMIIDLEGNLKNNLDLELPLIAIFPVNEKLIVTISAQENSHKIGFLKINR